RTEAGFEKPLPAAGGQVPSLDANALPEIPAIAATGLWIEAPTNEWQKTAVRLLGAAALAAAPYRSRLSASEQQLADFAIVTELGFPAYLGGPFALIDSVGSAGIRKMNAA